MVKHGELHVGAEVQDAICPRSKANSHLFADYTNAEPEEMWSIGWSWIRSLLKVLYAS